MRIQEIAEELVNLSVKEVNELAMVLNNGNMDMPYIHYEEPKHNKVITPKEYGQRKLNKRCKI